MSKYNTKLAQLRAYERRDEIKIGDAFVWSFSEGYGTSGKLPKRYMPTDLHSDVTGEKILRICRTYEGRNSFGPFVDYFLNETGVYDGSAYNCMIINGPAAFDMQRAKTKETEATEQQKQPETLNAICEACVTDCPGTTNQVWTGCVRRKTEKEVGCER